MSFVFDPPAVVSIPVIGTDRRFPVRRIFCIGRNYADHAREMGGAVERSNPIFFCKPADALVTDGADVAYPSATADLHHEVEMVVALGAGGRDLSPQQAQALIFGHAVGLDLTRRDLQAKAKAAGKPWDTAKAFDQSAPISALRAVADGTPAADTRLSLHVNGELRQSSTLDAMLWNVPDIIVELSRLFELKAGDLIFSGTPAGVAALEHGDRVRAQLEDVACLDARIV